MTENHNLTPRRRRDDADTALRPKSLSEFVGQAAALKPSGLAAALTASMESP